MTSRVDRKLESRKTYRCPCCRFKTLCGRGQDEICPVCFWHDDGQDDLEADQVWGGPNYELSLSGRGRISKRSVLVVSVYNATYVLHCKMRFDYLRVSVTPWWDRS